MDEHLIAFLHHVTVLHRNKSSCTVFTTCNSLFLTPVFSEHEKLQPLM